MINSHNELVCLTGEHGQVVWVRKLRGDPESPTKVIWNGPLAGGKLYIVSNEGHLLSLDPSNGKTLTELSLETPISMSPIAAQEMLYILTDNGDILSFK